MLKQRILSTLKFFDLQDYPLTLLELSQFLVGADQDTAQVSSGDILICLQTELKDSVQNYQGFYFLAEREQIAKNRLANYFYGIKREKIIKSYISFLKYLPFVRGAALNGSQAMGQQKETSDIDLFIITDNKFMWLARTLVTIYFQIIGKRRHHSKIQNRFCLNHYVVEGKIINDLKNLYTASEYLKMRFLVFPHKIWAFKQDNTWTAEYFPNAKFFEPEADSLSSVQKFLESLLSGQFGLWLEVKLKNWQLPKIRQEKYILVSDDELSFHPESKQEGLLKEFLKSDEPKIQSF